MEARVLVRAASRDVMAKRDAFARWVKGGWRATSAFQVDIAANYAALLLNGLLSLLLLPLYARWLGFAEWGVVAMCTLGLNLLAVFDFGLSQTMPRDVAAAQGGLGLGNVFAIYRRCYRGLAVVVVILGLVAIPWVLGYWVQGDLRARNPWLAMVMCVLLGSVQILNACHLGYWSGRQKQALSARRTSLFLVGKHLVSICLVVFGAWRAEGYMLGFLLVSVIEYVSNAALIARDFQSNKRPSQAGWADVRVLLRGSGRVLMGIILGMAVSQIDRVALSRVLSAHDFGVYAMILSLGLAVMQFQYPVMQANMPTVVNDPNFLRIGNMFRVMLILGVLPCVIAAVFAAPLLYAWLGASNVSAHGVLNLRLLLLSVALNALYHVAYQYILALDEGGFLVLVNFISLISAICVLGYGSVALGALVGGVVWLTVSLVQCAMSMYWLILRQRK
jgi:O-antigen/teichoic acid export membrane protein